MRLARDVEDDGALRFYDALLHDEAVERLCARIARISTAHWGDVHAFVADGLDYEIYLMDGSRISVDAEERPGHVHQLRRTLPDEAWITTVSLEDVHPSTSSYRGDEDFDSDGDSLTPDDDAWLCLTLRLRAACTERIDIDPVSFDPLVLDVRGASEALVRQGASNLVRVAGDSISYQWAVS